MRTVFWGVRGSVPAPGAQTAGIGGNTSCVEMRCGDTRLIFDAGTGLRLLGRELGVDTPLTLHLFFSHVHWDHIQGFPFFEPAFAPGHTIHMYGASSSRGTIESALAGQMEYPNFPVKLDELPSSLIFHEIGPGDVVDVGGGVIVRTTAGHHPGGVLVYRVEYDGAVVVYATDTEPVDGGRLDPRIVEIARGADVLIYDSMYTPEEYTGTADGRPREGWGHSTYEVGAAIAGAAGVGRYVLFHHDPDQSDEVVREKERRARALFPRSVAAYEGLIVDAEPARR
ncbi:MAG: MBL fold metallo-hydrolase [Myxococcales bacterium]|nr:MBL fold metallo-hydrolase [Myxococcales bacterium]